jgi:hypothetical protein
VYAQEWSAVEDVMIFEFVLDGLCGARARVVGDGRLIDCCARGASMSAAKALSATISAFAWMFVALRANQSV